jgi:hypothetical protein
MLVFNYFPKNPSSDFELWVLGANQSARDMLLFGGQNRRNA